MLICNSALINSPTAFRQSLQPQILCCNISLLQEVIPFRSMPRLSSMQKYSMCGSVSSPMRSINSRSFTYSVAPLPTINKETVLPKEPVKNLAVSNGSELSSNEGKPGNTT